MLTASNFSRPFTEPNTSNILDLRGPTNKSISRNADEIPSFSVSTQSGPVSRPPPPPPASKMLINRLIRSSFKIQSNRPPLLAIFALSRVDLNALRCDNPIELFAWNSNSSRTLFRTQQSPFQVPHGPTVQGQHQGRHRKNKQLDET